MSIFLATLIQHKGGGRPIESLDGATRGCETFPGRAGGGSWFNKHTGVAQCCRCEFSVHKWGRGDGQGTRI